ncbi:hypothetical protein [Pseudomarimonas salicorniae]|uniref:Uncharacterized protein n=1 Tax=Pseudomarimonas salicorniae TaxID=2933270 RepID=A0ABT0GLC0_9GAMM|nr:hypothetical protein [Lysobacter sp. CAU 1642]MCK7595341.1 hypothetical protein [Lysobacter sp. CAU 1642]
MWRWLKRILLLLLALVLLWLAISLSGLLPRLSAEQAGELSDLRLPPQDAVGERNALELIWSLSYEVPPAQRAEVMREDAAALDAWQPEDGDMPTSVAAERYPRREPADAPKLPACDLDCLEAVRADPEAWRAAVAARTSRLEALTSLSEYDHQRLPYRLTLASPIPPYQETGSLQVAAAALRYVEGDAAGALQSLCQGTADWRALRGRSDSMIGEMINLAWLRRGIQLFADIRAELPVDFPLPSSCEHAFAPPRPEERMSCDVFRTEFQALEHTLERGPSGMLGPEGSLVETITEWSMNREASLALIVGSYRDACENLPRPVKAWSEAPTDLVCPLTHLVFNPVGCYVARISGPSYRDYLRRERDLEGHLRLLSLADQLARQPDPGEALTNHPEWLSNFEQPVRLEQDTLILDLLQPRPYGPASLRIPLPGSRFAPGGASEP